MVKKIAKRISLWVYVAAPLLFLPLIPGCPLFPN